MFFNNFSRFFNIFFSGLRWTGELWSNCVFLILRNKEIFLSDNFFFNFFWVFEKEWFFKNSDLIFSKLFDNFLCFFWIFLGFSDFFFWIFYILIFFGLKKCFVWFLDFFSDIFGFFFGFFILFKVTKVTTKRYKVTTEHHKWPKISTQSIKTSFLAKGQKRPWRKAQALRRS